MALFLEREIIDHRAADGAGGKVHGGSGRQGYVNGAAMGSQAIFSASRTIAFVGDISTGGPDADQGSSYAAQLDSSACGGDFHVAARDAAETDGRGDPAYVHVGFGDVADNDLTGVGRKIDVPAYAIYRNGGRGRADVY